MKAVVDATKCNGYGTCAEHAPALFQLDEWGYAEAAGDGTVADEESARSAAAGCPEQAITLQE